MLQEQADVGLIQEKPRKKELTDKAKEKKYQKMLDLDKSIKAIEQYELFVFVYKNIIKKAKQLNDYKDAAVYKEKYQKRLEVLKKEGKEEIYQKALELKENAKKAEDLQWIRKEIRRIPNYKDVDEIGEWCDSMQMNMEKREKRNAWIRGGVILLVVCVIVFIGKYICGK